MKKDRIKVSFWSKTFYFILAVVCRIVTFLILGFTLKTDKTVREWKRSKKAFIILSTHPSEVDAVALLVSGFPRYTRFVVGAQQLYKGLQGKILRAITSIPKRQFTPDLRAIREIMDTIREGHILAMTPEGRVSMDGTENPVDDSTAKLIKKMEVPVAILRTHGTYFVKPPYYNHGLNIGKISAELSPLLTEDKVKELTESEIASCINSAIRYDASEELRGKDRKYRSKNGSPLKNVSHLFYRCPSCGKMYTVKDDGNKLWCESCGLEKKLSNGVFIEGDKEDGIPDTISGWNKLQLAFEHEYWAKDDASFSSKTKKTMMTLGKDMDFSPAAGEGRIVLSKDGLHYEDSEESLDISLENLPGVSADYEYGFLTIYQGDIIRRIYLEDERMVTRFVNSLMVLKGLK